MNAPKELDLKTIQFTDITSGINFSSGVISGIDESQVSDEVVVLNQHEYEILKYNGLDALKRKSGKFGGI